MQPEYRSDLKITGEAYSALHNLLGSVARSLGTGRVCLVSPGNEPDCLTLLEYGEPQSTEGSPFQAGQSDISVPVTYNGRELAQLVVVEAGPDVDRERLNPFALAAGYILRHSEQVSRAQSAIEETRILRELGMRLGQPTDLHDLLDSMVKEARRALKADYTGIAIVEPGGATRWLSVDGYRSEAFQSYVFPPGKGTAARTIAARKPIVLQGIGTDPSLPAEEFPVHIAEGGVSVLSVPLLDNDTAVGALILGCRTLREWQPQEIELAAVIANGAAVAITQTRARKAEMAQRVLLEQIIEQYPGVLVVLGPPPDWRIIVANSGFHRLLPEPYRSGTPAVGKSALDLRSGEQTETGRALAQVLARVFETGEPLSFEQFQSENPDTGTTYWNWQALPAEGLTAGNERSVMLIAHDVTEMVRSRHVAQEVAEVARSRAEELEMVITHMADGVIIFDENGKMLRMNPAGGRLLGRGAVLGLLPEGYLENRSLHSMTGAPHDSVQLPVLRALKGEVVEGENMLIRRPDGSETIIRVSCSPLSGPDGSPTGAVAILHDVTQDKLVERLKDEFLSIVSHELRTPLTAIIGYSDLMLRGVHGNLADKQAKVLNSVRANADRLLRLINDLLDVSKLESGAVQLRAEAVDIGEVVARSVAQTRILAVNSNVRITNRLPERKLNKVRADDQKLYQIIENLVTNAIKHTAGGSVTIDGYLSPLQANDPAVTAQEPPPDPPAKAEARSLVVTVRDTGSGLEEDQLARIWDRFYQVDTSVKRRSGGAGLGLTIVRNLVDLHGGQVWAHSAGPDRGSTFCFSLPIVEGEYGAYAEPGQPQPVYRRPAETQGDRRPVVGTVLVAEDDMDQREIIFDMLDLEGFEVVLAETGDEALELALNLQPSAIALDVILPRRDGWQVLEALRKDPRTRHIPVMIISVVDQAEFGKKLGADEYLLKPLEPRSLRTTIRRLVLSNKRSP